MHITRKEQLIVRATPDEKALIYKKIEQFGTGNFSGYARKMLIDGYVIHVDISQFQALAGVINKVGVNINQITKMVNATGILYGDDFNQLKLDGQWNMAVTKILPIRFSIEKSMAYICNPVKTDDSFFVKILTKKIYYSKICFTMVNTNKIEAVQCQTYLK